MPKTLISKRKPARRPIATKSQRPTPRVRVSYPSAPNGASQRRGARTWQSHAHDLVDQSGELFNQMRRTGASLWAIGQKISGHGSYRVNKNTLLTDSAPPTFGSGGGGIRIRHREYIRDINSIGQPFNTIRLDINPGDPHIFPFLSTIAKNFEQYRLNGLIFEYRPTGGFSVGTPNASMGVVNIATNYDVLDTPFTSKIAMDAYEFSSSDIPFQKIIHPVECARNSSPLNELYIAPLGLVPALGDPRFYYFGSTYVATSGQQTAQTLGELWVSYDVTLYKPKISGVPDVQPVLGITCNLPNATNARFLTGAIASTTTVGASLSADFRVLTVDLPPGSYSMLEWLGLGGANLPAAFPSMTITGILLGSSSRAPTFIPAANNIYGRETIFTIPLGGGPITLTSADLSPTFLYLMYILPRGQMLVEADRELPTLQLLHVDDDEKTVPNSPVPSHDFVTPDFSKQVCSHPHHNGPK